MHASSIQHKIVTIPDPGNSGPTHRQSFWEQKLIGAEQIELGDWAYGQYLLASLQLAPIPALADEALWTRSGDRPYRFARRDSRLIFKEGASRP